MDGWLEAASTSRRGGLSRRVTQSNARIFIHRGATWLESLKENTQCLRLVYWVATMEDNSALGYCRAHVRGCGSWMRMARLAQKRSMDAHRGHDLEFGPSGVGSVPNGVVVCRGEACDGRRVSTPVGTH
jgi:hypothetical protein